MPEELHLPLLAAAVLLSYLFVALRQSRSERDTSPVVVWREATERGWSEWTAHDDVSASVGYDVMLTATRGRASAAATAVQFAVVVQPDDAPEYTLRILYMSAEREPVDGDPSRLIRRELASVGCGGGHENG